MKLLAVFGTRPEALKMYPVIRAARAHPRVELQVCVTGQHRQMLDQVLKLTGIKPEFDLSIMRENQSLEDIVAAVMKAFPAVVAATRPDWVLVQGDTTTAFATGLSTFFQKIRVAHVEAGLRSHNMQAPWPEELNRKLLGQLAGLHFAPTQQARDNLLQEGIDESAISVSGNTIVDALLLIKNEIDRDAALRSKLATAFPFIESDRKTILVTSHRRESFDGGIERICHAIKKIAAGGDVNIVFPVHHNPLVRDVVHRILASETNVFLIEPVDYRSLIYLMSRAHLVLTDSGGMQEEAPSLGKPVLVMRDNTERMEGVRAGTAILVGTDVDRIVTETTRLISDRAAYRAMREIHNPYGDGSASERIIERLIQQ
jgi:UDP-N-acetylglucosamine 2-epimerase